MTKFAETQRERKGRFAGKNVAIAASLAVILVIAAFVVIEYVFGLRGCIGPCGSNSVSAQLVFCSSMNDSCEITLVNSGTASAQAIGCSFDATYGNASSIISTGGTGTLSEKPGGQGATISVPSSSSTIVYCQQGGSSQPKNQAGTPVSGTVFFSSGGPNSASFVGFWG